LAQFLDIEIYKKLFIFVHTQLFFMRSKFILFILSGMLPLFSMAQPIFTGNLTIFSEDGDKFYLVLNGERQNNVGQTNLRIEDLQQPYYNAKIIFEDKTIADITKNIPVADPQSGSAMDVTYKIKKDGSGKAKLRYFSAVPVAQGYVAPSNVYVMHYGNPAGNMGGSVTQTTTTTTQTVGTGTVGANVNVNGLNMNVSVNDPNMHGSVTQTTTTTSYSDGYNNNSAPVNDCYAMKKSNFESARATISNESFDETRLSTAKSIISTNCLTADQVLELCKLFSFEGSKLDFAKCAYGKTVDQNNYFKVVNAFTFSSSKDELNKYISGH
jgi:hypothetical protein